MATGAELLRALAHADEPLALGTLARAAGMSSGKAHRYLKSYIAAGLVQQDEPSGAYDLGPLAVRLGLAALRRYDLATAAAAQIGALRDAVDETILIAVPADDGPTVARIALSRHPVSLAVRVGTTFPLFNTATGHVAMAFGESPQYERRVAEERAAWIGTGGFAQNDAAFRALLDRVRATRLASVESSFLVGVSALAAPILASDGRLAAIVTAIGRTGSMDLAADGRVAEAMLAFCARFTDSSIPANQTWSRNRSSAT